jgi:chromosome segregation ATPase
MMVGRIEFCNHYKLPSHCETCNVPHRTIPQDNLSDRVSWLERENAALRHENDNITQRLDDLLLGLDKLTKKQSLYVRKDSSRDVIHAAERMVQEVGKQITEVRANNAVLSKDWRNLHESHLSLVNKVANIDSAPKIYSQLVGDAQGLKDKLEYDVMRLRKFDQRRDDVINAIAQKVANLEDIIRKAFNREPDHANTW